MPSMPRMKNRARKIAFNILGVPANIAHKRSKTEEKIANRLLFEETSRVV